MREGYFLDDAVRPEGSEKFILFNKPPLIPDQQHQRIEGLRGKWHHFSVMQQPLLGRRQKEWTKFVSD